MSNFLTYFYEWMKIDLKANLEYKVNILSHLSLVFIELIISLFSFSILKNNFDFFYLNQIEIIYFALSTYFIWMLLGTFSFSKHLDKLLILGNLNVYLVKPKNVFYQYFLATSRTRRFFSSGILFPILIGYVIYLEVNFIKFLVALSFSFLGGFFYVALICFLDSFGFFMKKGNFLFRIYNDADHMVHNYPYSFLEKSKFAKIWLLFPTLFFGSVVSEYLFGYRSFNEVLNLSLYIFLFFILCIFGTYLLWRIGLARYEGYN